MMSQSVVVPAPIGASAMIDGERRSTVTGWAYYGQGDVQARVEWWNGDALCTAWLPAWRLTFGEPCVKVGF